MFEPQPLGQRLLADYKIRAAAAREKWPEMGDFEYEVPAEIIAALDALPTPHHGCYGNWQEVTYPDGPLGDQTFKHYDSAAYWEYMEVLENPPTKVRDEHFAGGEGFLWLYEHPSRDDVLWLVETDGESGTHMVIRFGAR
jgi:hypothetical protein